MSLDTKIVEQRKLTRKEQRDVDSKTRLASPGASVIARRSQGRFAGNAA